MVRAADPDVLCVQESPHGFRWRSRCARLARECGLTYVAGGGTSGGTAILAHLRTQVASTGAALLSHTSGLHQRGHAWAVLERLGTRVRVTSVHLGLDGHERRRHVGEILSGLAAAEDVAFDVIACDLNEAPGAPAWAALVDAGYADLGGAGAALTFPARRPEHRIDTVLARPRPAADVVADVPAEVAEWAAPSTVDQATDHLPVAVDLPLVPAGQTSPSARIGR